MIVHHVVPQSLSQLLVSLYGEVEAVVSEEGHINLPVLLRETKHAIDLLMDCFVMNNDFSSVLSTKPKADDAISTCVMFHTDSSPESRHFSHVNIPTALQGVERLPGGGEDQRV